MASFNPGAAVWTPPKAGAPPERVKRSLSVSGTWRLSYPDPEGAENQIEGATNQGAAKTANTVVKLMKSANEKKGPSAMSRMEKGQAKEAGLPKDRPPQLMVAIEVFKHCCLRCPPRLHEAGKLIVESMGSQLYTIATFYEDAAVFVLSRMWFDTIAGCAHPPSPLSQLALWSRPQSCRHPTSTPSLLSRAVPRRRDPFRALADFLKVHPVAYCGAFLATTCVQEASAQSQFFFALGMLFITSLLKHLAEHYGLTSQPGFNQIPMMMKYVVGWAFAFAAEQHLSEIKLAQPELCYSEGLADPDCLGLDLAWVMSISVLAGLVLLVVKPLTQQVECGDSDFINWLEDCVEDFWQMLARGLSVTVMVLWYDTSVRFLTYGESQYTDHRKTKLHVLWAVSITYCGSVLSTGLEQLEIDLKSRSKKLAAGLRDLRVECVVTYSDLLQDSLAWVAGCAWVDVIVISFSSLCADPSLLTLLLNAGVSTLVASLAVAWFVVTGQAASAGSREESERYFVTNSFSFFVGWVWLVTARNAFGLISKALEVATHQGSYGDLIASVLWVLASTYLIFRLVRVLTEAVASTAGVEYVSKEQRSQRNWSTIRKVSALALGTKGKKTRTELV